MTNCNVPRRSAQRTTLTKHSYFNLPLLVAWTGLVILAMAVPQLATAITTSVNSQSDLGDNNPGDGECWTGGFVVLGQFGVHECTLRAAIEETNAYGGADRIEFSSLLTPSVYGTVWISPTTVSLPPITGPLTIDGTSHPAYDDTDPDEIPVIVLDGGLIPNNHAFGLYITEPANGSAILGLSIIRFPSIGLIIGGADNTTVQGNHIGLERGFVVRGNSNDGILIHAASTNTTIGRSFNPLVGYQGRGNVISGNGGDGIRSLASDISIAGNKIGTDRFGNAVVSGGGNYANGDYGVRVYGTGTDVKIGRTDVLSRTGLPVALGNTIAGNALGGIRLDGTSIVSVHGNHIGIGADGTTRLANGGGPGIEVLCDDAVIGEDGPGRNVISGHLGHGILVGEIGATGPNNVVIHGNYIGLNAAGDAIVGNINHGIFFESGATADIAHNLIGGNRHGIQVQGFGHQVYSNFFGTNPSAANLRNVSAGLVITGTAHEIGYANQGNVFGFNLNAISFLDASDHVRVEANWIGVDPVGNSIPQEGIGISLRGDSHRIGGGPLGPRANTIGNNQGEGIKLSGIGADIFIGGNYIGTNAAGDDHGNFDSGIVVRGTSNHVIGAYAFESVSDPETLGNVIAFNERAGIELDEIYGDPMNILMRGNSMFENGGIPIDLGDDGLTPNDVLDLDQGANNLQNAPAIDGAVTSVDPVTSDLTVRYLVDSHPMESAYPLLIDFYIVSSDGQEPAEWIGTDVYPQSDAGQPRDVTFAPTTALLGTDLILAIASDADNNTSETSNIVPVPEPGFIPALFAGIALIVGRVASARR